DHLRRICPHLLPYTGDGWCPAALGGACPRHFDDALGAVVRRAGSVNPHEECADAYADGLGRGGAGSPYNPGRVFDRDLCRKVWHSLGSARDPAAFIHDRTDGRSGRLCVTLRGGDLFQKTAGGAQAFDAAYGLQLPASGGGTHPYYGTAGAGPAVVLRFSGAAVYRGYHH